MEYNGLSGWKPPQFDPVKKIPDSVLGDLVINLSLKELRLCLLNCSFKIPQVVLCAVFPVCFDGCLAVSIPPAVGACRDLYSLGISIEGPPDNHKEDFKGFLYVWESVELASPYTDERLCDSQGEPCSLF